MISERVRAGLEQVRANGPAKGKKAIGRPLNARLELAGRVRQMRADGTVEDWAHARIGTGLVQRLALLKSSAESLIISPLAIRTRSDPPGFHRALTVTGPRSGHHHVSLRTRSE